MGLAKERDCQFSYLRRLRPTYARPAGLQSAALLPALLFPRRRVSRPCALPNDNTKM